MATLTTSYQLLGSVKTSTYSQLRLYGKYNSQSTDNNTSSVSLQLRLYGNGGQGSFSSGTAKISGTSYSLGSTSWSKGSEKTLCTKTYTATHSSDGTYTASISYSITSSGVVSGSSSASITLPQIKRTSVLGSISDFTFGDSIPITYTEYVSGYTANLKVLIGSTLVKTINNISSGTSISFTSSELNTIYGLSPNSTTPTVTFQLVTMNGSTQIGTNSKTATGTIPNSVAPTLSSVTLVDNLGYEQQIGSYVQNKSVIHGTITASGGTGASISSILTQINGETIYGDEFYTNELETSGTNYYSILITDTRGRSKTYAGSYTVITYTPIEIDFNVYRSDSTGHQDDDGNYLCINVDASIDPLDNQNTKLFKIETKQSNSTEWTTLATYNTSYNYVLTNAVYSGYSSSYPFDVRLTATDMFDSQYIQIWIPTAKTVLDFYRDGTGVAIGKVADTPNKFDVGYDTAINGDLDVVQSVSLGRIRGSLNLADSDDQNEIELFGLTGTPRYDETQSYEAGDYCVYDDSLQKCIGTTTGTFDSTKWEATDIMNEIKNGGGAKITTLWEGAYTGTSTSSISWTQSKYDFDTLRIAYRLDNWGIGNIRYKDFPVNKSGVNEIDLSIVYGYSSSTQQIRSAVITIDETSAWWQTARIQYRSLSTSAITSGGNAAASSTITVVGLYGIGGVIGGSSGGSGGTSNYNELTNKPSINNVTLYGNKTLSELGIATKTSDLTNDSGFITSSSLPTKTSDLTNDSGFITSSSLPTKVSDLTNDSGFITNTVDNLTNYYTKTNTYTKTETDDLLDNKANVSDIPEVGNSKVYYGTSDTGASTQAKVVLSSDYVLEEGNTIFVKFTNAQTYNGTATLNVNLTGAKNITRVGTTTTTRYWWTAGEIVGFVYDGTNYVMIDKGAATTSYYGLTKLSSAINSTSTSLAATPSAVKQAYDLANGKQDAITSTNKLDYSLIDNTPTIPTVPTTVSSFTNDAGYITSSYHDSSKQDTLVSGTNIKTINNQSLLGSGNITISSGGGTQTDVQINGSSIVSNDVANILVQGSYSSSNKIATMSEIPTNISSFTNDAGYINAETDPVFSSSAAAGITSANITTWNNKSDFSGDYDDLTNKPTIPTIDLTTTAWIDGLF